MGIKENITASALTVCFFCSLTLHAQSTGMSLIRIIKAVAPKKDTVLVQAVRGQVVDHETNFPLQGATVILMHDSLYRGMSSDASGNFRFEIVRVGRYELRISYVGYKPVIQSVLVSSSRELVLIIPLEVMPQELDSIVIRAKPEVLRPVGGHQINPDELSRHPGTRGEAIRKVHSLPGIQSVDDSRNDIVIRGNSPGSVMWRLEGVNIPNPNHFNISGTSGGPVSMINDKMLAASAFYTGAFPAEYGNTTSGIFDLRFRDGDSTNFSHNIQLGVLGAELSGEGPLSSTRRSSYLFSARTATLAVFQKMGVDIGTEATPRYTDASFKINFPGKKQSSFSIFGLGGSSGIDILISEGVRNFYGEKDRDQYFKTATGVAGMSYKNSFSQSSFLSATLALSAERINADHNLAYPDSMRHLILEYDNQPDTSLLPYFLHYNFREKRISNSIQFTQKLNQKGRSLVLGLVSDYYFLDYLDSIRNTAESWPGTIGSWRTRWNGRANGLLIQPYVQWKYSTEKIDFTAGIHGQYFSLTKSRSLFEPRLGFKYHISEEQSFNLGLGLHSQIQAPYLYFYQLPDESGRPVRHNRGMDFTRSLHMVVGYEHLLGSGDAPVRIKSEIYVQQIYNVPVEKDSLTSFSLLNAGATFSRFYPNALENKGKGANYGLELSIDKPFSNGYLFLFTGSLFESKYKGSDGVWRNTDFNGNYILTSLFTREWNLKSQNVVSLGTRVATAGGRRHGPVNHTESERQKDVVFLNQERNTWQFKPYFRADVRVSYKVNLPKVSHEFVFDLVNIFNTRNVLKQSYFPGKDGNKKGEVREEYQLGFLPFFYYRFDF